MFETKILKKHRKDCPAIGYLKAKGWQHWDTVWFFDRFKFGRKNGPLSRGNEYWMLFKCNIPDCPALAAIRHDDIATRMRQK